MRSKEGDEKQRGAGERGASLTSPPHLLLFFRAPFTSHRSSPSERLEQAKVSKIKDKLDANRCQREKRPIL